MCSTWEQTTTDHLFWPSSCWKASRSIACYLLPIIGALATLHDAGIVHRDIKPSNIFLRDGARNAREPKLLDFGLAHTLSDARLTRSGLAMGTPLYMAPEQARGDSVGPAADVWSMGVVLYECLAGCMPFQDKSPATYAAPGLASRLRPLSETAPQLPSPLAYAVERALRRDLSQRYRSMRELAQGLVISAQTCDIRAPSDPDPVGLPELHAWQSSHAAANTISAAAVVSRVGLSGSGAEAQDLAPTPASPTSHRGGAGRPRHVVLGVSALLIALSVALGYGWLGQVRTATPAPTAAPLRDAVSAPNVAPQPAEPTAMPIANEQRVPSIASSASSPEPVRDAAVSAGAPSRNNAPAPRPVRRTKSKVAPAPRPPHSDAPAVPNPFHVESDWR